MAWPQLFAGIGIAGAAWIVLAVLAGAFVKGYSGFGASMMWVASLSLVLPPQRVVPMVLLWEVASSAQLLPAVWRDVRWRSLGWLLLGAMVATPLGAWLLAVVPDSSIRLAIGVIVIVGCALIARGYAWRDEPGAASTTGVGALFGLLNGSTALGGPPVVLFYLATPTGASAGRASIIALFLATDAWGAATQAIAGLLPIATLLSALILLPLVIVGTWVGDRHYLATEPESFKRFSIGLLMLLGVIVLVRASSG